MFFLGTKLGSGVLVLLLYGLNMGLLSSLEIIGLLFELALKRLELLLRGHQTSGHWVSLQLARSFFQFLQLAVPFDPGVFEDALDRYPIRWFELQDLVEEIFDLVGDPAREFHSLVDDVVVDVLDFLGPIGGVAVHKLVKQDPKAPDVDGVVI